MFEIQKTMTISIAHCLKLDYESKCVNMHGHNLRIMIYCRSKILDQNGMVVDFTEIKRIVNEFDHVVLNEHVAFKYLNPTAENMAQHLCGEIPYCYKVEVEETEGNKAVYVADVD